MCKVSIIIPAYNSSKTIERCIRSIFKQDFQDYEIIVVNDGSKDNTGEILDQLAQQDNRLKVIHKKNGGVSSARNTAFEHISGEYVQFMDADDLIPKGSTKALVKTMETYNVDMVIGDYYRVVEKTITLIKGISKDKVLSIQDYAEEIMNTPRDFYYGVLWNKLYKASIIKEYRLRMDDSISFCEDFVFNTEYLNHSQTVKALKMPVYYYIKNPGSLCTKNLSFQKVNTMKAHVYLYYNRFFMNIFDRKRYFKNRRKISRFLVSRSISNTLIILNLK